MLCFLHGFLLFLGTQFSMIFMAPGLGIILKNISLHNPKGFLIFSFNSLVFLYLHLKFLEHFSTQHEA